jgi:hypothetical protein
MNPPRVICSRLAASVLLLPQIAFANDVQPRLFNNVPVGANFLSLSASTSHGEVTVDGSLPVADVDGSVDLAVLSYSRGLDIGGNSALVTLAVPYAHSEFEGIYLGQPAATSRKGLGDPRVRLGMNFYGATALRPKSFAGYRQRTIAGVSLEVSIPAGHYFEDRVINIGSNRWGFFTQAGVSHRVRQWTLESALGAVLFTDNDDVLGDGTLEQKPIGTLRASLRYNFTPALWLGVGVLYTYGGRTTLNGNDRDDRQDNMRTGVALSFPLARRHQLQFLATEGITARIGSDFTTYQLSYTFMYF